MVATIIVVTHNTARWRARQKAALEAQTDKRWQLVIIDNASRDDERPRAEHFPNGAEIIQSDVNLGFAEANNIGARHAATPYLVFLNPDAFPEPDWFAKLIAVAERFPQAGAIGCLQRREGAPGMLDGVGDVLHASGLAYRAGYGKRGTAPALAETFSACAAAMLVRREALEEIGGFDERYFCYFEDVDLGFRLRLAGWRIVQSPDAIVSHVGGGSAGATSAFAEFHGARNRLWTFIKCMPGALMWLLLPAHIVATALVSSVAPIRGRGLGAWRGIIAGWTGLGPILATRTEVQSARKVSIGNIAAALTWSPDVLFTRRATPQKIRG